MSVIINPSTGGGGGGITINTTTITGGVSGNFLYNNAGTVGERTPTQATAALNLFTNTLQGLVPGSGGGTTNFLRADGTWAAAGGTLTGSGASPQVAFWTGATALSGDSGFTYAGSGQATLALGTITTNKIALNITGTWNAGGVTFDAPLFMNITNTASAAGSLLADFQIGSATLFNVSKAGSLALGGAGACVLQLFGGAGGSQASGNYTITLQDTGTPQIKVSSQGVFQISQGVAGSGANVTLATDAVGNILALNNGTANAQGFRVYNTSDSALGQAPTNYERGVFDWTTTANVLTIGTQNGGTGTLRPTNVIGADIVVGTAALATNATDGFLYIPTCAGTPTGTPTSFTGRVPMVFDTTNSQFWFFTGGAWKQPKTPAAAAIVTWQ